MGASELARTSGLSVILPAYNAAGAITATIRCLQVELTPLVSSIEFIVVDDGSHDSTAAEVIALMKTDVSVRLLQNRSNLGKGASVCIGCLAATKELVCFTDADLPFAPGSYARIVTRLLQGADFVAASRRLPQSEIHVRMAVLGYAARRHFVGVVFNSFVRAGLRLRVRDTQCGLKGFTRSVGTALLQRTRSLRFLFDIELFVAARAMGVDVAEVPVSISYNERKTTMRLASDSTRMLGGLAGIAWRDLRGDYTLPNTELDAAIVRSWAQEVEVDRRG
jgi:dolichyl-phosphate beta-glucosyltransferase